MIGYAFPGALGLLVGLLLHWTGLHRPDGLRHALGLRRSDALRSALTAVGWSMAMTAILCWLAVIDVDTIVVLPLSLGAVLGGVLLGIAAALSGFVPGTVFAGLSAAPLEALCTLLGCWGMTLLLPSLEPVLAPLRTSPPFISATLFRTTLDEAFLVDGGFLGQGCVGAVLIAIAMCIPAPRPVILTEEAIAQRAAEAASVPEEDIVPPDSDPAAEAAEETVVIALPEEEPIVIDTALDESAEESAAEDAPDEEDIAEDSPDE